jgi:hypothetical protein
MARKSRCDMSNPMKAHQIRVARKTLKTPDAILDYMNATSSSGGMTKEEARAILRKNGCRVPKED